jgi:hypothetical protein
VNTDLALKRLFKTCGQDLVWLTGDRGARIVWTRSIELQEIRRSIDFLATAHWLIARNPLPPFQGLTRRAWWTQGSGVR